MKKIIIRCYFRHQIFKRTKWVSRLKQLTVCPDSCFNDDLKNKRKGRYLLAWSEGQIIGWALLSRRSDDAYQIGVYVDPKHRRQGIGTKLVRRAKQIARRYQKKIAGDHWNRSARQFFTDNNLSHRWYELE